MGENKTEIYTTNSKELELSLSLADKEVSIETDNKIIHVLELKKENVQLLDKIMHTGGLFKADTTYKIKNEEFYKLKLNFKRKHSKIIKDIIEQNIALLESISQFSIGKIFRKQSISILECNLKECFLIAYVWDER